jgi:RNA polymerase primary sigma factor
MSVRTQEIRTTSSVVRRGTQDSLSIYMQEIECIPVLSPHEEHDVAVCAKQGDEAALEKLVRHNLRFVVSVARRFRRPGTPLEDLINEGNVGLVQAARRFNPDRGCRLVTYARWWIRQSIFNYLTDRSRLRHISTIARTGGRVAVMMGSPPRMLASVTM